MNQQDQRDHQISLDIVDRLSKLAKLSITESEHDVYVDSIDSILNMLHKMDDLDLSNVNIQESKVLVIDQARKDEPSNVDMTEYLSEEFKSFDADSSLFQVPEFIDQD